jgi:hypothetical protein
MRCRRNAQAKGKPRGSNQTHHPADGYRDRHFVELAHFARTYSEIILGSLHLTIQLISSPARMTLVFPLAKSSSGK